MKFTQFLKNLHREESGQDLIEYALVAAAIIAAVLAGSGTLSGDLANAVNLLNAKISAALA